MENSSLETNYRHIVQLLNEKLKQWHPDVNKDERAPDVTRFILQMKERARRLYEELKGGSHVL